MLDKLTQIVILATLQREENFTRTAERLGISKSHVSKQLTALEDSLGCQLVERSTRTLHFTEIGREYAQFGATIIAQFEDAEAAVRSFKNEIAGTLRVALSPLLESQPLFALLGEFQRDYPALSIEVTIADPYTQPSQNLDCYLSGSEITEQEVASDLLHRDGHWQRIDFARFEQILVASPAYIERHGSVTTPSELAKHQCIGSVSTSAIGVGSLGLGSCGISASGTQRNDWWLSKDEHTQKVALNLGLRFASPSMQVQAAKQAMGIALVSSYVLQDEIHQGELVRVLPEWHSAHPYVLSATLLKEKHQNPRIRCFLEFVAARLSPGTFLSW
uniref:LysR family transcriptional regulator n=1 Tax=Thaumasiovibrio occultus TaxID=1891184 RepID=UPI000B35231E|nr:LysR family transcriptional regulator [Thaumasiovibrio occultus]